jgi:hypothetical protein
LLCSPRIGRPQCALRLWLALRASASRRQREDEKRLEERPAFVTTKPHVAFDIENDSDELMVGIAITNAGLGPAAIKAVTF